MLDTAIRITRYASETRSCASQMVCMLEMNATGGLDSARAPSVRSA